MFRMLLLAVLFVAALCAQATRILRFVHIEEPQSLMEAATVIRSIAEIRDLKVDAESRTITLSGEPLRMDLAAWLSGNLDRSLTNQRPPVERYEISSVVDPAIRIFYPARTQTIESLQELTVLMRSVVEIRRAFTFNRAPAVIMRGTRDEIAAAEWLFNELDQRATAHPASETWRLPGDEEGIIRVFYLRPALSVEELMKNAISIREEAKIRRMFTYNSSRAIAVRGTAEQVAVAERLIRERQVLALN
jgi:hypothetical protein